MLRGRSCRIGRWKSSGLCVWRRSTCATRRYRLSLLEAEEAMARSLRRYGQMAPIVVCLRDEVPVLVDGFKRLAAARGLKGLGTLSARRIEVDERNAKAAMYGLNRIGRHFGELEEAWLVQALVREDGLSQVEVATLLGRHKSWVCRRLAMMEKLCGEAQEDLRLGLLSPTMARQLTRLPAGNQQGALESCAAEFALGGRVARRDGPAAGLRHAGEGDLRAGAAAGSPAGGPGGRGPRLGPAFERGRQSRQPSIGGAAWTSWPAWQTGCGIMAGGTWRCVIAACWNRPLRGWRARPRWWPN